MGAKGLGGNGLGWSRQRDVLLVVLALALPFWLVRASTKAPEALSIADRGLMMLIAPLQAGASALGASFSEGWKRYVALVGVRDRNSELEAEAKHLRGELQKREATAVENQRLRRLLDLKGRLPVDAVSARVIAKSGSGYFGFDRVVVERPLGGMRDNLPVIAADGVVGTTVRSLGDTIDVRLVGDPGSGIDVVVERTGARGIVRGLGPNSRQARLEYARRDEEIVAGDVVMTSGLGQLFPRGIPVGRVAQVNARDFGTFQQVTIDLAVDPSRLEEVLILVSAPPTTVSAGLPVGKQSASGIAQP